MVAFECLVAALRVPYSQASASPPEHMDAGTVLEESSPSCDEQVCGLRLLLLLYIIIRRTYVLLRIDYTCCAGHSNDNFERVGPLRGVEYHDRVTRSWYSTPRGFVLLSTGIALRLVRLKIHQAWHNLSA